MEKESKNKQNPKNLKEHLSCLMEMKIHGGGKIDGYLQFLTHTGETRFPIFACGSLPKLCHFVNRLDGTLTLTLEIV